MKKKSTNDFTKLPWRVGRGCHLSIEPSRRRTVAITLEREKPFLLYNRDKNKKGNKTALWYWLGTGNSLTLNPNPINQYESKECNFYDHPDMNKDSVKIGEVVREEEEVSDRLWLMGGEKEGSSSSFKSKKKREYIQETYKWKQTPNRPRPGNNEGTWVWGTCGTWGTYLWRRLIVFYLSAWISLTCLDVFIMSRNSQCVKLLTVVADVFMLDVGEVVDDYLVIMHDIS